jgi:predicted MFS family arabinose efflux permease
VSYQWLLPLVFVGGLLTLPIFSVVRQSLGVLADGDQRRTAFALDAITTEMVFMIGPAAGAVVATSGFTTAGLTVVGVATSLAGLFLMWFNPPTRSQGMTAECAEDEQHAAEAAVVSTAPAHVQEAAAELAPAGAAATAAQRGLRGKLAGGFAWFTATVAALFAVAAGAGMVLSGTDVGIVAALEIGGHQSEIGIVFVFWCAASVLGGLVYGAMHRPVPPIILLLGMAALTLPMAFAHDTWTLAFVSVLPGLLCAPVLSAASEKVADLVSEERRGEAMGWYGSALTAGVALGSPLAGIFIDVMGPSGGFVSVGAAGVVLCLVGLVLQQRRRKAAV